MCLRCVEKTSAHCCTNSCIQRRKQHRIKAPVGQSNHTDPVRLDLRRCLEIVQIFLQAVYFNCCDRAAHTLKPVVKCSAVIRPIAKQLRMPHKKLRAEHMHAPAQDSARHIMIIRAVKEAAAKLRRPEAAMLRNDQRQRLFRAPQKQDSIHPKPWLYFHLHSIDICRFVRGNIFPFHSRHIFSLLCQRPAE